MHSAGSTRARNLRASSAPRRGRRRCFPGKCRSNRGRWLSPSSRAAMWLRNRPLLSWPGNEDRHPPRIRPRDRDLQLWEHVPDAVDEARAARRDLLELPPVLYGQAEAHGHGRPGGALPEEARARRARQAPDGPLGNMASNVGGQAVLEGVMMRGPGNWAVAVRTPNGDIAH